MEENQQTPHKRRVRYKGKYPKKFEEKYKELHPNVTYATRSNVSGLQCNPGSTPDLAKVVLK